MKTRYKISLVIGSFVAFYFALIPALQVCIDSNNDCTVWQELVMLTRPVISSSTLGEGIGEWSGTVDGKEPTQVVGPSFILDYVSFETWEKIWIVILAIPGIIIAYKFYERIKLKY